MGGVFSGPMFEPSEDEFRKSSTGKTGGHYNIFGTKGPDEAMDFLRLYFPDGEANELNFVLFSTSGVHGLYTTLEEEWASIGKPYEFQEDGDPEIKREGEVTFLLVQPRIVGMTYGNARLSTSEDFEFLKKLRASSWAAVHKIGASPIAADNPTRTP
ncbi:hypothetical protein [Pseudomonas sp.]|uniref:hypothetical protein n=1 Tax=Pseudomonas sp. TaxID=306 RepID=UPI002629EF90|nr:hypothetical protein [Pseudomonas sp.]